MIYRRPSPAQQLGRLHELRMFVEHAMSHAQSFGHINHRLRHHSAEHETELVGPKNGNEGWRRKGPSEMSPISPA